MRLSRQSALALALFLGLLAVALVWFALRSRQPASKPAESVQIPVARETIPANTDLTPEMFEQKTVESDKVPKDVITDSKQLTDRITLHELPQGEPVSVSAVVRRSISKALAYGIPENYRALTVAVDDVSGVANFIRPGDYIDLVGLFTDTSGELSVAITVLQDTLVLAVNSATEVPEEKKEDEASEPSKSRRGDKDRMVTLAVTPHEAQLLALSDFRGELRMALRRTGDHALEILARSQSWSLVGGYPQVGAAAPNGHGPGEMPAEPSMAPGELPSWARTWGMPPTEGGARPSAGTPATGPQPPSTPPPSKKPTVEVIRGFERENVEPAQ